MSRPSSGSDMGRRAVAWREAKGFGTSPEHLVAKLAEEVGEVARAVIADVEGRSDRGDARQEAAQVVILLSALLELHYPGRSLMEEVTAEMQRCGA